jgi:hypothetical protein
MKRTGLSSKFIGRPVIMTLAAALTVLLLSATAFAQGTLLKSNTQTSRHGRHPRLKDLPRLQHRNPLLRQHRPLKQRLMLQPRRIYPWRTR